MRRAAKIDLNHTQIVRGIRDCGFPVLDLAGVGGGCPDIAVPAQGIWRMVEIKRPERRGTKNEFTPAQIRFHAVYGHYGDIHVAYCLDDALRAIGAI